MNKNKKSGLIKIVIGTLLWILPMLINVSEYSENYSNFYVISLVFKIIGSILILVGLLDVIVKRKLPIANTSIPDAEVIKNRHTGVKIFLAVIFALGMFVTATNERISGAYWVFWILSISMSLAAFMDSKKRGLVKFMIGCLIFIIFIALLFVGLILSMRTSWF